MKLQIFLMTVITVTFITKHFFRFFFTPPLGSVKAQRCFSSEALLLVRCLDILTIDMCHVPFKICEYQQIISMILDQCVSDKQGEAV